MVGITGGNLWGGVADPKTKAPWTRDTVSIVFSCTKGATALCAHVLASRGNIAIDALGNWLGASASRWLDRFAALVSTAFFSVMAWQYWRFSAGLKDDGQTIPVLRWPAWPWWAAVAFFVLVAAVTALLTLNVAHEKDAA